MRRIRAVAGLAAAAFAFASCGLEVVPDLPTPKAPDTPASDLTPVFQVVNNPTTVPSDWFFELKYGFELYYKFYTRDQAKEESLADRNALIGAGYRRVASSGSLSAQVLPLIPIDPADQGSDFDVTLDFNQPVASEATYNVGDPAPVIGVRRSVEHLGSTKTFAKEDLAGTDEDVSAIWDRAKNVEGDELHLAMYAMSFGMYNLATPLYSTPRYLGYMVYRGLP